MHHVVYRTTLCQTNEQSAAVPLPSCFLPPHTTMITKSSAHIHPSSYEEGKSLMHHNRYGDSGGEVETEQEGSCVA